MQIVADITGYPVFTIEEEVEAALGAAMLAALGAGLVDAATAERGWVTLVERARPEPQAQAVYRERFEIYKSLYPASGIGRAVAVRIAQTGAQVTAVGRQEAALQKLQEETGCNPLVLDVADPQALDQAFAELPAFDLVVNCAGIALLEPALELQAWSFDAVMAVNARAAALVAARCGKAMAAAGVRGSIVNVSSQAALVALDAHLCYCASKAALDAITRSLCLELGPHGIRVNSVNPT
ncbi:unnamed protein product, partial [Brugia timori]|uniref:FGGY_C domain-containing protein n=1 Tax=Brugia timori TaxID=42155 RepID=A0A0R3QIT8_9BILA